MDARAERALLRQCQQDDRESRWRPAPAHDAELKAEAEAEAVTTFGRTDRQAAVVEAEHIIRANQRRQG